MRILHTSDWHLGRSFGDFGLLHDQETFIDWLVELTAAEAIDLVVISGDLHDRAIPPADAVSLLSEAIRRLRSAGAEVAAIAGNHDSGDRIGAFDGLVDAGGVILRGGFQAANRVSVRNYSDGPLAIVATPFLEPLLTPPEMAKEIKGQAVGRSPRISHEMVLGHALQAAKAGIKPGMRSLVLAHAFVTGAAPSDSERDLSVGDAGMVSASLFHGFSYVALGHLHRPQTVAGTGHIRYSGSPLPYSFSEAHQKSVVIVDLAPDGTVSANEEPITIGRGVKTVRGAFSELVKGPVIDDAWVRVQLTDTIVIPDAHRALRKRFPCLVEIARPRHSALPSQRLDASELEARSVEDLAQEFWAEVASQPPSAEVSSLLNEAVAEAGIDEAFTQGAA